MSSTTSTKTEMAVQVVRKIFCAGIEAVLPSNLIRNQLRLNGSNLNVQKLAVDLKQFRHSYVVGFGKAVLPMAEELLMIIGPQIDRCILSVPAGTRMSTNSKIEVSQGAKNNVPDVPAFEAAQKILTLVKACTATDLLIVLISGGGSALLPYPQPPVTLEEKATLIKQLSTRGASINELNSVRKAISLVKGGGLVQLCPAKQIISFILSDVLGDKLDVIASGPTVKNSDGIHTALQVVNKYISDAELNQNVRNALANQETSKDDVFQNVENVILGNNKIALEASAQKASENNLIPLILSSTLDGEAESVGHIIAEVCHLISMMLNDLKHGYSESRLKELIGSLNLDIDSSIEKLTTCVKLAQKTRQHMCLLLGGETTVHVKGTGIGGRNQELALSASIELDKYSRSEPLAGNVTILSGGTDGIDGPCEAAGAIINSSTVSIAKSENLNYDDFLRNNDSFNFFARLAGGKFHLITGHTGTNVMDMLIAIIEHKDKSSL